MHVNPSNVAQISVGGYHAELLSMVEQMQLLGLKYSWPRGIPTSGSGISMLGVIQFGA